MLTSQPDSKCHTADHLLSKKEDDFSYDISGQSSDSQHYHAGIITRQWIKAKKMNIYLLQFGGFYFILSFVSSLTRINMDIYINIKSSSFIK